MKIQESAEDYLEAILSISEEKEFVRAIDVVHFLNISKPSVSVYLKNLKENGYVNVDSDGHLTLTDEGLAIAEKVYDRHKTLANIFMALGVDRETALKDACRVEHDLSDVTYDALKNHLLTHQGKNPKENL
jgi:Mn-dependent DtxR family transcriptional regulator